MTSLSMHVARPMRWAVCTVATTIVSTASPAFAAGHVPTEVDAALAVVTAVGDQPVGEITDDITTAFSGGTRDDQSSESTLGNLVANALRDSLAATPGGSDIGVVNPGALGAELMYAGDTSANPANTDGVVTLAEANAVLPTVNNLYTVSLTGAQFKNVLEQQWQPDGTAPTFLNLGLSDNISVTYDLSQERGSHISSVRISGQPLDFAAVYKVATSSFLANGGDNFMAFTEGIFADSGVVDRDAWITYLSAHAPLSPNFARRQVQESGMPRTVVSGQQLAFTLSKLDLTSLGSPANTTVAVGIRPVEGGAEGTLGSFDVTDGMADIDVTVPPFLDGDFTIVAVAEPSGTTVAGVPREGSVVTATVPPSAYGTAVKVSVTVDAPVPPTGTVTVSRNGINLETAPLEADGTVSFSIKRASIKPGQRLMLVTYSGSDDVLPCANDVVFSVTKAGTVTTVDSRPARVVARKTAVKIDARVSADGVVPTGKVIVSKRGKILGRGTLADGRVTIVLHPFASVGRRTLAVRYLGGDLTKVSADSIKIRVVKSAR